MECKYDFYVTLQNFVDFLKNQRIFKGLKAQNGHFANISKNGRSSSENL
jgi:hypothetical protein